MTLAIPRLDRSTAEERGLTIADFLVPIRLGERVNARVRDVSLVIAGALLIYLTARISIPVPGSPVPVTGQTFGVLLVGGALGFRRGLIGVALYVLLGVIGLPFFAEGKGGISVIWGATGGYLIGFVVAGALVGRLAELGWDRKIGGALGAMVLGNVVVYLIALPWLGVVTSATPAETIERGLAPFVIGDALKLVLAAVLFPVAWWVVGRRPDDR
ncbi:MAG TPA: biotin transporter BioY [Candidatus Limnocylindrales bacterium]|nr:biotin transporter BioY [Candidatus Limnocylindrales bacterium]